MAEDIIQRLESKRAELGFKPRQSTGESGSLRERLEAKRKELNIAPIEQKLLQFPNIDPNSPQVPQIRSEEGLARNLPGIVKAKGEDLRSFNLDVNQTGTSPFTDLPVAPRIKETSPEFTGNNHDQLKLFSQAILSGDSRDVVGTFEKLIVPKGGSVRRDREGKSVLKFPNGKEFQVFPKGIQAEDVISFAATTAPFIAGLNTKAIKALSKTPYIGRLVNSLTAAGIETGRQAGIKSLGGEFDKLEILIAAGSELLTGVGRGRLDRSIKSETERINRRGATQVVDDLQLESQSDPNLIFKAGDVFMRTGRLRTDLASTARSAQTTPDFKLASKTARESQFRLDLSDTIDKIRKLRDEKYNNGTPLKRLNKLITRLAKVDKAGIKKREVPNIAGAIDDPLTTTTEEVLFTNYDNARTLVRDLRDEGINIKKPLFKNDFKKIIKEVRRDLNNKLDVFPSHKAARIKFEELSRTSVDPLQKMMKIVAKMAEPEFVSDAKTSSMIKNLFTRASPREISQLRLAIMDTGKMYGKQEGISGIGEDAWNNLMKARMVQAIKDLPQEKLFQSGEGTAEFILGNLLKTQRETDLIRAGLGLEATKNITWLHSTMKNVKRNFPKSVSVIDPLQRLMSTPLSIASKARSVVTGQITSDEFKRRTVAELLTNPAFINAIKPLRKAPIKSPTALRRMRDLINEAAEIVNDNAAGSLQGVDESLKRETSIEEQQPNP